MRIISEATVGHISFAHFARAGKTALLCCIVNDKGWFDTPKSQKHREPFYLFSGRNQVRFSPQSDKNLPARNVSMTFLNQQTPSEQHSAVQRGLVLIGALSRNLAIRKA